MKEMFDEEEMKIWDRLSKIETPEPNSDMKVRFNAMMQTYKEGQKENIFVKFINQVKLAFRFQPAVNWAFSLVLAGVFGIAGYFIGRPDREVLASQNKVEQLSEEVQNMKEVMMLTMLENPTATERLKAVSYTQDLKNVDDKVIDALLTTLNNDENDNVRIMTVEALVELAHYPKVREGLVQSLMHQESPLVQVALADAMVKLQEKKSVRQLKKLLEKQDLNETVKTKVEQTIIELS